MRRLYLLVRRCSRCSSAAEVRRRNAGRRSSNAFRRKFEASRTLRAIIGIKIKIPVGFDATGITRAFLSASGLKQEKLMEVVNESDDGHGRLPISKLDVNSGNPPCDLRFQL